MRTIAHEITPMLCGSAFKNKGVQAMLDAVVEYLPSPVDVPPVTGENDEASPKSAPADDEAPFAALAFKIMTDPYVGQLTFLRVYSGVLSRATRSINSIKSRKERVGRLLQMHANQRDEIKEVRAGDIAAAVGMKDVTTGDTLCDPDKVITLERMVFPEPVISQAVEPKTKADQEKMGIALNRLAQEDPSFRVHTDDESGQTIISGMGELHLEIIVDRMKREFGVEATVGKPQVAYRETIRKTVDNAEGKFIKQSGGRGQYGHVVLKLEPQPPGKGFEFVDAIKGGVVPREYIPAVEKGVNETLKAGVLAGYPVVDVKVTLHFGLVPRGRLERERVQDGRVDRLQGRHARGLAGAARADHGGRSRDARGEHGRRHGRSVVASRRDPGYGRHCGGGGKVDSRRSAAGRDVRLLDDAALADAGPRDLHDGVQALRRGAEERRRGGDHRQDEVICEHQQTFFEERRWQKANLSVRSRM